MLHKNEWIVRDATFNEASLLIKKHHYAQSHSKQRVAIHGLYKSDDRWGRCYGVTWWLPIASMPAGQFYSDDWTNVLCLSRLVIVPDAPKNSASFLLSRSIKLLPERWHTLATYADEYQNHTGAIYRATNWQYLGLTNPKPVYVKNGEMVSIRTGDKTLTKGEMIADGCELVGYYRKHRFKFERPQSKQRQAVQLMLAM